jgi:hypothetical protein
MDQTTIDENKKLLAFLYLADDDLRWAAIYAHALLENEGHKNVKERYSPRTNALDLALVVSYSRPFKFNRGFQSVRKHMDKFVKEYDVKEKQLHDHIISLRDQEYAHSDAETNVIEVLVHGEFIYSRKLVRGRLSFELIHQLADMIDKLHSMIDTRSKELRKLLAECTPKTKNEMPFMCCLTRRSS